jgi:ABC-type uncharacterized transport system YnjBCD permease subunit
MQDTTEQMNDSKSGNFWLWVGLLLPPIAWITQLQTLYLTSEYGCITAAGFSWNHVASAVAFILSAIGGVIAWRDWKAGGGHTGNESGRPVARKQFMSLLGLLTGALFTLVIVAQWLPTIVGVPCDK